VSVLEPPHPRAKRDPASEPVRKKYRRMELEAIHMLLYWRTRLRSVTKSP
jgi:hypothetical protein